MSRFWLINLLGIFSAVLLGLLSSAFAQDGPSPKINNGGLFQNTLPTPPGIDSPNTEGFSGVFEPAQVIAIVGDKPILAGDLLGVINQMLAPYEGKAPPEQIEKQRKLLLQQMLPVVIETKLAYLELLRDIPPERVSEVHKQMNEQFEKYRLGSLLEQAKVNNAVQLDAKLRRFGSSLDKQKRIFAEQFLAQQQLQKEVDQNPEVTHQEMRNYYRQHIQDYSIPSKVRWEKLTVRFDKFPNQGQAKQVIATMGNEVYFGAPLPAVAKRRSQGFNAKEGGFHDWTTKGSLASKALDEAIFSLPTGKLSRIIEDKQGFHIVRVIERTPEDRVPFTKAQVEIKQQLIKEKIKVARVAYVARLRNSAPVWTIFDKQAQGDRPPRR